MQSMWDESVLSDRDYYAQFGEDYPEPEEPDDELLLPVASAGPDGVLRESGLPAVQTLPSGDPGVCLYQLESQSEPSMPLLRGERMGGTNQGQSASSAGPIDWRRNSDSDLCPF